MIFALQKERGLTLGLKGTMLSGDKKSEAKFQQELIETKKLIDSAMDKILLTEQKQSNSFHDNLDGHIDVILSHIKTLQKGIKSETAIDLLRFEDILQKYNLTISNLILSGFHLHTWKSHHHNNHAQFFLLNAIEQMGQRRGILSFFVAARQLVDSDKRQLVLEKRHNYDNFLEVLGGFMPEELEYSFKSLKNSKSFLQINKIEQMVLSQVPYKELNISSYQWYNLASEHLNTMAIPLFNDITNQIKKEASQQYQDSLKVISASVTIILLLLIVPTLLLMTLSKMLKARLTHLPHLINQVTTDTNVTTLQVDQDDELGDIVKAVNRLLHHTTLERENLQIHSRYTDSIINSLNDMLFVLDPHGRITRINSQVSEVLYYDSSHLVNSHFSQVLVNAAIADNLKGRESMPEVITNTGRMNELITNNQLQEVDAYLLTREGEQIEVILSGSNYLNSEKKKVGSVILAQAASSSKLLDRIQEQSFLLMQSSKMASIGEMSANIGHEVNNPLMVIIQKGKILAKKIPKDDPKLASLTNSIIEQAERISKITRGLLHMAHSAQDGQGFQPESCRSIIDGAVNLCNEKFKSQGVELRLVGMEFEAEISCHMIQLSQVILNLMNNAYHAIKQIDKPWIELAVIAPEDEGENEKKMVKIYLTDCGSGIPDEVAQQLFTPLFTTKKRGEGTGLGLSISQKIIEQHGGTIKLDQESSNTRFVITLPIV
jgi:signal transduction histidine kinase